MTEYETCGWCARPSNQPHRPNCPRPGEVFTATDLRNARAEATEAAERRLREGALRSMASPLDVERLIVAIEAWDNLDSSTTGVTWSEAVPYIAAEYERLASPPAATSTEAE